MRDDFPADVGDALAMIAAAATSSGYQSWRSSRCSSRSRRASEYLEDVPVADTVLVLQALALQRDMAAELESQLLP